MYTFAYAKRTIANSIKNSVALKYRKYYLTMEKWLFQTF